MNSYEYKLGRFKYYYRTAKGEETFNPYKENSLEFNDWQEGYKSALLEQSRIYLKMQPELLIRFFNINEIDLVDGPHWKMKKDLNNLLKIKLPHKHKEKQIKI